MLCTTYYSRLEILLIHSSTSQICVCWSLTATLSSKNMENLVKLVCEMSIEYCRQGDLESITAVGNMEYGEMKTNQNGVLKIAENKTA